MKTIIFIVIIPMLAGILTTVAGYSFWSDQWGVYLAFNIPICAISAYLNAKL